MNFSFLFKESFVALKSSPVRTFLTMLGVIIGVAAVIAMMSISGGAKLEAVRQIESLGASNIYVKASRLTGETLDRAKKALSTGLSRQDVEVMENKLPWLEGITYEWTIQASMRYRKAEPKINLVGVGPSYFDLVPVRLRFGQLISEYDLKEARKGVVLGGKVAYELFGNQNPVGKFVTIREQTFRVIGSIHPKRQSHSVNQDSDIKIGERDRGRDVYFPYSVIPSRFPLPMSDLNDSEKDPTYSELSMIILKLKNSGSMKMARDFLEKILDHRHRGVRDYQVIAPIDILEKSNKIQDIFNWVMIFIASLSLVVGGIGIMNIMLANIQQRVKEIGIRRAIGATRQDILYQFLLESVVISVGGGLIGVLCGILISTGIATISGWTTVLSISSVIISFGVSVSVGLLFGIFPAYKASELDPIAALRYE